MKRIVSVILSLLCVVSLAACTAAPEEASSVTSSAGLEKYAEWLGEKIGDAAEVFIGTEGEEYGITMEDFRDDGYVIRTDGSDVVIIGKTEYAVDLAVHNYAKHYTEAGYSRVYHEGYAVGRITLAGHDISEYTLVVPAGSDENVKFAAQTIHDYTERACGVSIPTAETADGCIITFADDPDGSLGDEGFIIETSDGRMVITHGRYRGALYGALEFVEQYEGWRFLLKPEKESIIEADYEYIYESEHVEIPAGVCDRQVPDIPVRSTYGGYFNWGYNDYMYKYKYSGETLERSAKYGGYGLMHKACHGLHNSCMFPEFQEHIDENHRQRCYSDPDNVEMIVERYLERTRAEVAAGAVIGRDLCDIDVAQYDNLGWCECERCRKIVKKEGSLGGPMFYMANAVADAVAEEFPGLYVDILAYIGSSEPPKVTKPRENVKVSYCFYLSANGMTHFCAAHPFDGKQCSGNHVHFSEQFERWCEISSCVDVWYYGESYFPAVPTPCIMLMLDNFRYLKEHDCYSVFFLNGPREYQALTQWISQKLMWDCDISREELLDMIREYFLLVFGDSGEDMYEYFVFWEESLNNDHCISGLMCNAMNKVKNLRYHDNYEALITLFDHALEVADSFEIEEWIEIIEMHVDFLGIQTRWDDYKVNGTDEQRAFILERYERLYALAQKHNYMLHNMESYYFPATGMDYDFSPMNYTLNEFEEEV